MFVRISIFIKKLLIVALNSEYVTEGSTNVYFHEHINSTKSIYAFTVMYYVKPLLQTQQLLNPWPILTIEGQQIRLIF